MTILDLSSSSLRDFLAVLLENFHSICRNVLLLKYILVRKEYT